MVWNSSGGANPYRLYRDTEHAMLAGVCAGIADYVGVAPFIVRLMTVLGLIFFFVPSIVAYIVLALALRPKPPALYGSRDEEAFWRDVRTAPADTLHALKRKFGGLEGRLHRMESQVASGDFELHRKFRDLGQ